jgi:hypothetical protein
MFRSQRTILAFLSALAALPASAATDGRCSPERRRATLRAVQAEVLGAAPNELASLDAAIRPGGALAGWQLSHGHVVLAGAGSVAVYDLAAKPPLPHVLLYAPSTAPESWLDFDGEDGPYRLVGWAFVAPYEDGSRPPVRPCLVETDWFVHQAGWHLMDGSMVLTPDATAEPSRPQLPAPVHFWHPRVWDVHFWRGDDGVPTVSLHNPKARGGLALPAGAFFRVIDGKRLPAPPPPGG